MPNVFSFWLKNHFSFFKPSYSFLQSFLSYLYFTYCFWTASGCSLNKVLLTSVVYFDQQMVAPQNACWFCTFLFGQIVSLLYWTLIVVFTDNSDQLALGLLRFLLNTYIFMKIHQTHIQNWSNSKFAAFSPHLHEMQGRRR